MSAKDTILFMLEKNRGSFISGQKLAQDIGVSRNAVWKSIKALKSDGYDISSDKTKGYMLNPESDKLSAQGISAFALNDVEVYHYSSVDSTNNEAKRMASQIKDKPVIITADTQLAGRGRLGRAFYSPANTGLYMTVMLKPTVGFSDAVCLTSAAAVCVCDAIKELTKLSPKIKWVNDIYIDNKKVCGILTEAVTNFETMAIDCIIVGIGINISTANFPNDLKITATSLSANINKNKLCALIFDKLIDECKHLKERRFIDKYRQYSLVIGKDVSYTENGTKKTATAIDIDKNGGLVIKDSDGTKTLSSGEISLRLI